MLIVLMTFFVQSGLSRVCFALLFPRVPVSDAVAGVRQSGPLTVAGAVSGVRQSGPLAVPVMTVGNHRARAGDIDRFLQFVWLHGSTGTYNTSRYL